MAKVGFLGATCFGHDLLATVSPTVATINFGHFRRWGRGGGRVADGRRVGRWGPKRWKSVGARGPEGWGQKGWGPPRVGASNGGGPKGAGPKISRFFFLLPGRHWKAGVPMGGAPKGGASKGGGAHNFALLLPSSLWGSSRGILVWCFGRSGPQMCLLNPGGLWGFHTTWQARELQTCTFQDPGAPNTTKIPRKDPKRRRKRAKSAKLGSPPFRASHPFGAPTFCAPKIQHPKIGRSWKKNWPKSKLTEVDRALECMATPAWMADKRMDWGTGKQTEKSEKKRKREEETEQTPFVRLRPINQFRLRPIFGSWIKKESIWTSSKSDYTKCKHTRVDYKLDSDF